MIPDVRIKYNGVNVRLVGWGFRKLHNLRILETGLASIKGRLAKGTGQDDTPTKPLSKRYARYKSYVRRKKAIRDLDLTGQLLDSIKPRYADDRQAIADAGTRLGRMKARLYRDLLLFSPNDQAAMGEKAAEFFGDGAQQVFNNIGYRRAAVVDRKTAVSNRRAYFGR